VDVAKPTRTARADDSTQVATLAYGFTKLTSTVDETLRYRAERAILQRNDSDRPTGSCQLDGAGVFVGAEGCHDATGGVAGGQIGYRWQSAGWVFGVEAQGDWADLRGSNASLAFIGQTNRSKIDAFGLFTGQVGYAWNNALLYVKGGAAITDSRFTTLDTATGIVTSSTGDNTRWGGTVGVGLEYGFAPNWSVGVEYDHLYMQDKTLAFTAPGGVLFQTDRIRQDVDLVTARVNYRFGGPVIGRY